jgi:hypothetical protein
MEKRSRRPKAVNTNTALVTGSFRLEKFPGKGGWTYAALPQLPLTPNTPFGWLRVKGTIDDYAIAQYHLMPMGNGHLFLPVKASIRKSIKKNAGDLVTVQLWIDESPLQVPEAVQACLADEPLAARRFAALKPAEKKKWLDAWRRLKTAAMQDRYLVALIENLLQQKPVNNIDCSRSSH